MKKSIFINTETSLTDDQLVDKIMIMLNSNGIPVKSIKVFDGNIEKTYRRKRYPFELIEKGETYHTGVEYTRKNLRRLWNAAHVGTKFMGLERKFCVTQNDSNQISITRTL